MRPEQMQKDAVQVRSELRLPVDPVAPSLARAHLSIALPGLPERAADDVALLTSEVVSNAVRHASQQAAAEILLRVKVEDAIRVEVVDSGKLFDPPSPHAPHDVSPSGWGLYLLDSVADAWGVDAEPGGKKVWFQLGLPPIETDVIPS